jgi:hypothetical protein
MIKTDSATTMSAERLCTRLQLPKVAGPRPSTRADKRDRHSLGTGYEKQRTRPQGWAQLFLWDEKQLKSSCTSFVKSRASRRVRSEIAPALCWLVEGSCRTSMQWPRTREKQLLSIQPLIAQRFSFHFPLPRTESKSFVFRLTHENCYRNPLRHVFCFHACKHSVGTTTGGWSSV